MARYTHTPWDGELSPTRFQTEAMTCGTALARECQCPILISWLQAPKKIHGHSIQLPPHDIVARFAFEL